MRSNFFVSLSAQVSLQKRLDTIASNIANVGTAGYRGDGVTFASVMSKVADTPTSFVTTGNTYISRAKGPVTKTDNPLDVAVQGDAWLSIRTPEGPAYTRDGRLTMAPNGELQTLSGYPVLDAGGAAMLLDSNAGAPSIAADGMISQGGRQVGALGLFSIPPDATLSRYGNSAVIPNMPATPVLDFTVDSVAQGYSEGSNVNPVLELTKLIQLQRSFDQVTTSNQSADSSLQDAIKTLGATS